MWKVSTSNALYCYYPVGNNFDLTFTHKVVKEFELLLLSKKSIDRIYMVAYSLQFENEEIKQDFFKLLKTYTNSRIYELQIKDNQYGRPADFVYNIGAVLKHNQFLSTLNFQHCGITDQDLEILLPALHDNSTLIDLGLSENDITSKGMEHMAKLLQVNSTIQKLNLMCNNHIGNEGLQCLVPVLQTNTSLITLNLSTCKFKGPVGVQHFAAIIQANTTLRVLFMAWNGNSEKDFKEHLIPVLRKNCFLSELDVHGIYLTKDGILETMSIFDTNSTLTYIRICPEPSVPRGMEQEIRNLEKRNQHNIEMRNTTLFDLCKFVME